MELINNVYVINMDKSKDRWDNMVSQEPKIGKTIIRIPAVVGKELTKPNLDANTTLFCKYFCSPSMIGCFLSHRKAWETMVNNGDEYSIIMEDDCEVVDDFQLELQLSLNELSFKQIAFDFIYLGCFGDCSRDETKTDNISKLQSYFLPQHNKLRQFENTYTFVPIAPVGFHCYLLTNSCARQLLALFPKADYHVDVSFLKVIDKFNVYATSKNLAYQYSTSENSTQSSKFPILLNKILNRFTCDKGITYGYYMGSPIISILGYDITPYTLLFLAVVVFLLIFPIEWLRVLFVFYLALEILVWITSNKKN